MRAAISRLAKSSLRHLPYFKGLIARRERNVYRFPPGHFYSPIPDPADILARAAELFPDPLPQLDGIDLNVPRQIQLMESFARFYPDQPFTERPDPSLRYYFDNGYYRHGDGICLHSMIRYLKPRRIIEVGSGFSSANILDTNERFAGGNIKCTFIEPFPDRLMQLLRPGDEQRIRLIREGVQHTPPDVFQELESGDILLIDSSHVSRIGSDVNHLVFNVLPHLKDGVAIHFHDMFYPFEYPKDWIVGGIAWNEAYLLRAFLQYNSAFHILFFTTYMTRFHREFFAKNMPLWLKDNGASLWIRKGPAT